MRNFLIHLNYLKVRIRIKYKDQCLLTITKLYRNKGVRIKLMMAIIKERKMKGKSKRTMHIIF